MLADIQSTSTLACFPCMRSRPKTVTPYSSAKLCNAAIVAGLMGMPSRWRSCCVAWASWPGTQTLGKPKAGGESFRAWVIGRTGRQCFVESRSTESFPTAAVRDSRSCTRYNPCKANREFCFLRVRSGFNAERYRLKPNVTHVTLAQSLPFAQAERARMPVQFITRKSTHATA